MFWKLLCALTIRLCARLAIFCASQDRERWNSFQGLLTRQGFTLMSLGPIPDSSLAACAQDGEMRKNFQRTLTKQGFKFKLGMKVLSGRVEGDTVKLELEPSKGGDKETLEADVVLVSAGVCR